MMELSGLMGHGLISVEDCFVFTPAAGSLLELQRHQGTRRNRFSLVNFLQPAHDELIYLPALACFYRKEHAL